MSLYCLALEQLKAKLPRCLTSYYGASAMSHAGHRTPTSDLQKRPEV